MVSKLVYCLHTDWLNNAEWRRLDASQTSCFRKIFPISHSFISRVSNAKVLSRANHRMLSKILQYRQIPLLKRVADLPSEDVMKHVSLRVIFLTSLAYKEAADADAQADAQGNVGLLKCTGLLKPWPIMTGVRLTVCGSCLFLDGNGGLRISAWVPIVGTCSCPCVTVHEAFSLIHFSPAVVSSLPCMCRAPAFAHQLRYPESVSPWRGAQAENENIRMTCRSMRPHFPTRIRGSARIFCQPQN